ncbi:MAG: hypothetical protein SNH88_07130 [Rikenellaceae bacterium]
MYSLYIDQREIAELEKLDFTLSYDSSLLQSIDKLTSQVVTLTLPSTSLTDDIFEWAREPHPYNRFHAEEHTGTLYYNAELLFEGQLRLLSVVREDGSTSYKISITREKPTWASNASASSMAKIESDFSSALTIEGIKSSWSEEDGVRFMPIHRDSYDEVWSSSSNENVRRIRTIDDYHPFLHAATALRSIFSASGYTLVSDFVDGDEFDSLYVSGAYASVDGDAAREQMNFLVKRGEAGTSTAGIDGRVYITGGVASNSVGYMVSLDTLESDDECFSTNGCMTSVDGVPAFVPLSSTDVGFVYRLCYTTDYRILTRERLRGFDTFYLAGEPEIEVELVNNFADKRGELRGSYQYLLLVFDHISGDKYQILDGNSDVVATIDGRSGTFTTPSEIVGEYTLYRGDSDGWIGSYSGDWALYDGYVTEEGELELDLTIRSAPVSCSPTSPVLFTPIYAGGANPGMSFTLQGESSISPYFAGYPGYGSQLSFEDVGGGESTQMQFITSLQQIFNLMIYTDPLRKRVYIEPYDSIAGDGQEWDWSSKLSGNNLAIYDRALSVKEEQSRGYQLHDGYTLRLELEEDEVFGRADWLIDSSAAESGSNTYLNPLYSPSCCDEDGVLIVGDRDDLELVDSYDFSPRVAYQLSGSLSDGSPRLAFHSPEDGMGLCFEDRDGVSGLYSRFYAGEAEHQSSCRVAQVELGITPYEAAELLSPREGSPSVLSLFRITISGEQHTARMLSMEGYNPENGTATFTFLLLN